MHNHLKACIIAAALLVAPALSVEAASSTSKGQISVAQVVELLNGAETDPRSRQILTAYLAGLGETAGMMIDNAGDFGASVSCDGPLVLDTRQVSDALAAAAGDQSTWIETAATPIILADLVQRAGCR